MDHRKSIPSTVPLYSCAKVIVVRYQLALLQSYSTKPRHRVPVRSKCHHLAYSSSGNDGAQEQFEGNIYYKDTFHEINHADIQRVYYDCKSCRLSAV